MRQIILHIGSHKTGTTALQSWIETNRAVLAQGGLADLYTPGDFNAHKWLTFDDPAAIFPAGYRLGDPATFAQDILDLQAERVLVSSENFAFFFREEAIAELAATLKPLCDDIVVLAYIRRQDRHAVSHHMEGARADRPPEWQLWGHGLRALPEANALQPLYLDYDRRLAMWQRHFGADAVKVRVFDRRFLVDGDIVADFTHVLGIDRSGCTASGDVNTSLDRVKTRMGHMANVIAGRDRLTRTLLISTRNTDLYRPIENLLI